MMLPVTTAIALSARNHAAEAVLLDRLSTCIQMWFLPDHFLLCVCVLHVQLAVKQSLVAATCISSAIGCFMMCFLANMPLAVTPGMGINAFFA
jgi:xanthine/uracil/vitamin C permease (AzgA family)